VWFCLDLVLRECLYSDETLRRESAIKGVKMEKQMLIMKTYEASHKPAQWDCLFKHQLLMIRCEPLVSKHCVVYICDISTRVVHAYLNE